MSNLASYHRTYSQSGFSPPSFSGGGGGGVGGPSTLERAQRSRSFDHRRDFWDGTSPRAHFVASDKLGANGFFNESVTIPVQRAAAYTVDSPVKQYRSAVELNSTSAEAEAAAENEWTSYDRTVRYSHNRTELPAVVPQHDHSTRRSYASYCGYGNHHPEHVQYALRHSDDVEQQRRYQQQQQQQYRQQHSQGESYYRQHQSDYDKHHAGGGGGTYADEDYAVGAGGGASTYGRYAGGGGGSGYRSYRYEAHRSGGHGGGHTANGYSSHSAAGSKSAAHHKSHVNTNRGGLFSSGDKSKSKSGKSYSSYHYYRDPSLPAPKRQTVHHKVHCCCFSFYWPPWGYQPSTPPTPIFYSRRAFAQSAHGGPPPSSWGVTPQISPRPHDVVPPYAVPPHVSVPPQQVNVPQYHSDGPLQHHTDSTPQHHTFGPPQHHVGGPQYVTEPTHTPGATLVHDEPLTPQNRTLPSFSSLLHPNSAAGQPPPPQPSQSSQPAR